mmetsp:Transcript_23090/g.64556  ORF Transcript_23090/g.64556 Transcript_23090/m.64556 type:complete len:266 (+) Transcript_23090:486-1283(+)
MGVDEGMLYGGEFIVTGIAGPRDASNGDVAIVVVGAAAGKGTAVVVATAPDGTDATIDIAVEVKPEVAAILGANVGEREAADTAVAGPVAGIGTDRGKADDGADKVEIGNLCDDCAKIDDCCHVCACVGTGTAAGTDVANFVEVGNEVNDGVIVAGTAAGNVADANAGDAAGIEDIVGMGNIVDAGCGDGAGDAASTNDVAGIEGIEGLTTAGALGDAGEGNGVDAGIGVGTCADGIGTRIAAPVTIELIATGGPQRSETRMPPR